MDIKFGPAEQVLWPMSILSGIIMCKIVYEVTGSLSLLCFKGYAKLSKPQKIEWNNRGFSTFHAILVAVVSFYLVVVSDLFKDGFSDELFIKRKSAVSDAIFGVSLGYFLTDLGMILWLFPALGGKEYLIHHGLSMYAISLSLLSGQAHLYILMILFSEITTPFINLRWYLDLAGQKNSKVYLWNGIAMSIGWLVARVILFIYFFAHMYLHFDQPPPGASYADSNECVLVLENPHGLEKGHFKKESHTMMNQPTSPLYFYYILLFLLYCIRWYKQVNSSHFRHDSFD